MSEILFGVPLFPARDVARVREFAATAEAGGLDLIGVQTRPTSTPIVHTGPWNQASPLRALPDRER